MNITVIYSTGRKAKSSTYNIAQLLIKKAADGGKLFEFYLPKDMPHICAGCYACIKGNETKCGGYGYMKPIIDAMEESNLIIFCSPTYAFHTPGQMKTFLDHMAYRWMVHRPDLSFMKKQAVIINTAGGGGKKSAVKDIKDSTDYWGIARTHVITQSVWEYDWTNLPEKFKKSAEKKVNKAAEKIKKYEEHITPSFKVNMIFKFYRFLHSRKKMSSADDEYWERMGYTNK